MAPAINIWGIRSRGTMLSAALSVLAKTETSRDRLTPTKAVRVIVPR